MSRLLLGLARRTVRGTYRHKYGVPTPQVCLEWARTYGIRSSLLYFTLSVTAYCIPYGAEYGVNNIHALSPDLSGSVRKSGATRS